MTICRADTVCGFYMAAERYGLVEVKKQCQAWLQHCLMVPNFATLLCHISLVDTFLGLFGWIFSFTYFSVHEKN